jgi:hypothetical protein
MWYFPGVTELVPEYVPVIERKDVGTQTDPPIGSPGFPWGTLGLGVCLVWVFGGFGRFDVTIVF